MPRGSTRSSNALADYYRAQRPTADLSETLTAPDDLVEDDIVHALLPCVAAIVDALPDAYREALRRSEYEGRSQKELLGPISQNGT